MSQPAPSPAVARAERLAAYVREDPDNAALLADACDAAMAAGLHALASQQMDAADALGLDRVGWTWRRARQCIAQRRLEEAASLLQQLRATQGEDPGIVHDLAYVRLLQGSPDAVRDLLAPWLAAASAPPMDADTREALQLLWLRATHRLLLLDEAWQWTQERLVDARLEPAACGAA
ncbi:MAG TPA: hypothetical protein VIL30_23205, partial [Ramlibacter sp.]